MRRSKNKRGRSFDSVPADDGFRNYMSRKIELQRKQFGLVLPPPPDESSPSDNSNKVAQLEQPTDGACSEERHFESPISDTSSRKSVRFHANLEQEAVKSVSDVLANLKQRHSVKKSSLRRRKYGKAENKSEDCMDDEAASATTSSVQGVLSDLQKRHGRSLKRKRHCKSILEAIESGNGLVDTQEHSQVQFDTESYDFEQQIEQTDSELSRVGVQHENKERSSPTIDLSTPPGKTDESCKSNLTGTCNNLQAEARELKPSANSAHGKFSEADTDINDTNDFNESLDLHQQPSDDTSDMLKDEPALHDDNNPMSTPTKNSGVDRTWSESKSTEVERHHQAKSDTYRVEKRSARADLFFSGIVVLINGHTNPDATTLMRLLHKHGGDLEKYETRRVTHIIAERLSTAKANIYKNQKSPTPVCRPEWITDSVEKGKLLPFGDYLLKDVMEAKTPGTKSLKSFFGSEKSVSKPELDAASKIESETHRWADTEPSKSNYHINGQVRTVGNDPNFLDSYFSNSRLSYIGSFKQRVKTANTAATRKPKADSKRFVLLVDMDCFFAAVALKNYPQYRNSPIAVGHCPTVELKAPDGTHSKVPSPSKTLNNSSSELSTCNYIARKFGIRKGMFLGDAIKLCPQLVVLPYDFPQYQSVSGVVAEKLHHFADQFNGSVEQVSCDESYVEIHVSPQDYDGHTLHDFLKSLAEQIRKDIFDATECTASIGVGRNKFLSKLAADKVKPDASSVVNNYQELLDGLALRDLHGIGRKIEKKLNAHNLRTVNDIWDLGEDAESIVGEILGASTSHKLIQFCRGEDDRPVMPQARKSIGAECNYGVRFDGPFGPHHMLTGLSKEVEKRMESAAVRGCKLTLKVMKSKDPSKMPGKFLGHGSCEHMSKSMDIPLTRSCDVICKYSIKLFEKVGVDKELIRGMGLILGSLEPDSGGASGSSPSRLDAWLNSGPTRSSLQITSHIASDIEHEGQHTHSLAEHNTGASMPTYSQLDQDVLTELPEDILKEVQSVYGKTGATSSRTTTKSAAHSPKSKQSKKIEKVISIPGQVSVKRMLKLASVKSGEEKLQCANEDFTLSQLECLPLETQLQIANNDNVAISKLVAPHQMAQNQTASVACRTQSITDIIDCTSDSEDDKNGSTADIGNNTCDLYQDSRNFYHENILPLQEFIKSTPSPENDDINTVIEFLTVCVEEHRLEDVVIFLRTIKTMHHGWDKAVYEKIKQSTLGEVLIRNGYTLDIDWLGL